MSIVVYKCDTCNREIELPQQKSGLEVMSHCIISHGCKGKLIQTYIKTSHIRGKLPNPDPNGLVDWVPRKVYSKSEQTVPLKQWKVHHNLGTHPSIQVHITLSSGQQIETSDFTTTYVSLNEANISFPEPRSGFVQCFARTSIVNDVQTNTSSNQYVKPTEYTNITGGAVLTLSTPVEFNVDGLKIGFISDTDVPVYLEPLTFSSRTSSLSPWWTQSVQDELVKVHFSGKLWDVQTSITTDDIISEPEIKNGSAFFFTNTTSFVISSIDEENNGIVVDGYLDTSLLPLNSLRIVGASEQSNNHEYVIISSLYTSQNTTIVSLQESVVSSPVLGHVEVDYPIEPLFIYALLSTYPYSQFDKDVSNLLDLSKLSYSNTRTATYQENGQMFVDSNLIQGIFPTIISL